MNSIRWVLLTLACFAPSAIALGDDPDVDQVEFFEKRIRPALVRYCYECHSAASQEAKGDLRLDSRDAIRQGGESGPAVVPGDLDSSLLIDAIRHESLEMPPDQKLPGDVIDDFVKWIEGGAPDPRDQPPSAAEAAEISWEAVLDERREWWSLQPTRMTTPPQGNFDNPIDAFIHARQREAGISPSEPASAAILVRRLSLVLTGVPPTTTQVSQFVTDYDQDPDAAYHALVERLLESPQFGEHWARHWMDVVRFAETHGYEWNHEVRNAWRYRDYLIRAFNHDVPYDQLIREHIAGDLLDSPRFNEKLGINESIIGTAFWRFGELGHDNCVDFPEIRFDALDNQIDTFSKAFQGLTISCARCHDHKLDAISSRDYYALVGMLENCSQVVHTIDMPQPIEDIQRAASELKLKIREELAKRWLNTIDGSHDLILKALVPVDEEKDADIPLLKHRAQEDLDWSDPGHLLGRLRQRDQAGDLASAWQQLKTEYEDEQARRLKSNADNFELWTDFGASTASGWSTAGLGLLNGPSPAGEFVLADQGDKIVSELLPAGLYTDGVSNRLNGSLRSPWIPTRKKFVSVRLIGKGRSMVRTVVDSCALNEFAGGGLEYLADGSLRWKRFPTSAGPTHRSFIELTTRSDNPRWPDRPGRAGTNDPEDLKLWRSAFGVTRVYLHDSPTAPLAELNAALALFRQSPPTEELDVASAFQAVAREAVVAWSQGRASDEDVQWVNWWLQLDLLPNNTPDEKTPDEQPLVELLQQYRDLIATIPQPRVIAGLADQGNSDGFPVLYGGDPENPGPLVPARYIEVIAGDTQPFSAAGSGRRQLAELIAGPGNPLTARVMTNRVWQHLLGRGIVATPDDFGRMGEQPTHPDLLDYLSVEFVKDNWSIKRLIRTIVTSRTFRQASRPDPESLKVDPGNALLHHFAARRLDAESIRDSVLAVSGRLDPKLHGPSINPHRKDEKDYRKLLSGPLDGDGRRSIYTKVTRMEGPQFLALFDFPDPMATRGRRDRTNVPAQALALLNDPFMIDQARFWAQQLIGRSQDSVESRVQYMFLSGLGRLPTELEQDRFVDLIRQLAGDTVTDQKVILANESVWQDAAHAIFNTKEFIYIQ